MTVTNPHPDRKVRVVADCDHVEHMTYRDRWAWCSRCGRTWFMTREAEPNPVTGERGFKGWVPAKPEARPSEVTS